LFRNWLPSIGGVVCPSGSRQCVFEAYSEVDRLPFFPFSANGWKLFLGVIIYIRGNSLSRTSAGLNPLHSLSFLTIWSRPLLHPEPSGIMVVRDDKLFGVAPHLGIPVEDRSFSLVSLTLLIRASV